MMPRNCGWSHPRYGVETMPSLRKPRVLVFAFACSPRQGSEAAAGWGEVRALEEVADLTVLTRPHNITEIEQWRQSNEQDVEYVAVTARHLGSRGHSNPLLHLALWRAYYLRWLAEAAAVGRRMHASQPFDAIVHATLGIYWLPTPAVHMNAPSVWGPVSGAASSPPPLYRYLGVGGVLSEWAEIATARLLARTPWTRGTWRSADIRLVESESTRSRLPRALRPTTEVVARSALCSAGEIPHRPRTPLIVFSSPLERRKAPALALDAFARTPDNVRMAFIHRGPEEAALRARAERLGVAHRVEFRGKVPRDEMTATLGQCAAVVFTGLREEGGAALAEAMRGGVPVVVLGHGGAGTLARASTDTDRVAIVEPSTPRRTVRALAAAMTDFAQHLRTATHSTLADDAVVHALQAAVLRAARTAATTASAA